MPDRDVWITDQVITPEVLDAIIAEHGEGDGSVLVMGRSVAHHVRFARCDFRFSEPEVVPQPHYVIPEGSYTAEVVPPHVGAFAGHLVLTPEQGDAVVIDLNPGAGTIHDG